MKLTSILTGTQILSVALKKPPTLIVLPEVGQVEVYHFHIKQNRSKLVALARNTGTHF